MQTHIHTPIASATNRSWLALSVILVCISLSLAQPADHTGTLTAPAKIPIMANGAQIGAATLTAGTKIKVLKEEAGKVLIAAPAGQAWVESTSVRQDAPPQEAVAHAIANNVAKQATMAPVQESKPTPGATPVASPKTTQASQLKATTAPQNSQGTNGGAGDKIVLPEKPADDEVATFPPPTAPIITPDSPPVGRKKVLVLRPSTQWGAGFMTMWQIAKQLKEKGHEVRLLGTAPKNMKPDDCRSAFSPEDWLSLDDLHLVEMDAVVSPQCMPNFDKIVYEAIDLGKIVIINQPRGPWPFVPDKKEGNKLEADYLRTQKDQGYLEENNLNSGWENAPWAKGDSKAAGIERISELRPGDVVCWKNLVCYAGSPSGHRGNRLEQKGYKWDYGRGWEGIGGYNSATVLRFTIGVLMPVVQEALRTYNPAAFAIEPKNLKAASFLPLRPKLPRTFPLERPKGAGPVIGWGRTVDDELIPKSLRAVQVAVSYRNTCIGLKPDGTVVTWGRNNDGQCNVPEGLSGVVQVAVGDSTFAALKEDGTVVSWGKLKPDNIPENLSNVVQVAITSDTCYYLKADGSVVKSRSGKQADNDFEKRMNEIGKIVQISGGFYPIALSEDGKVAFLSSGNDGIYYVPKRLGEVSSLAQCNNDQASHVAILLIDGTVSAWGRNDSGQCNVPMGLSDVAQVATSDSNSFAVKRNGELVGWGSNFTGQLDIPPSAKNVIQVAPGNDFCIAITKDAK